MSSSSSPSFLAYDVRRRRWAPCRLVSRWAQNRHWRRGGQRRPDGSLRDTSSSGAPRARAARIAARQQSGGTGMARVLTAAAVLLGLLSPAAQAQPQTVTVRIVRAIAQAPFYIAV